ncbi:hypothetical protein N566_14410 [Streptomycetaceae bacterium MP113-05]|nr:hypothetical protein N566_14410 [Streptomycetaceae bacterium MP113-05]
MSTVETGAPRPRWRFALSWAELDVFTGNCVPGVLRPVAALVTCLGEDRFRPAVLRFAGGRESAFVAVWPPDRPGPPGDAPGMDDLRDVALAEVHDLSCLVCAARYRALYPEAGLPLFGTHLAAHRLVSGCPRCGSDFAASRVQALALLPSL